MTLDLEVLILIPKPSHLAAKCSNGSWRPLPDKAKRTTSSAKTRDEKLMATKLEAFCQFAPPRNSFHKKKKSVEVATESSSGRVQWPTENESKLLQFRPSSHYNCTVNKWLITMKE